jgi:hypothetical protein
VRELAPALNRRKPASSNGARKLVLGEGGGKPPHATALCATNMITRRREQVSLILGLIALNASLVWDLHRLWKGYRERIEWIYAGKGERPAATSVSAASRTPEQQSFVAICDRDLFNPKRSMPKPAEQEAKVPDLPLLFGTMNLGDGWFALMSPGGQPAAVSKRVLPGEEIGGYKLVSIGISQVVVEWREKKFTIDLSESARRVPRIVERTVSSAASAPARTVEPPASATNVGHVTSAGSAPASATSPFPTSASRGKFNPAGYNAPAGATVDAPAGTVLGGKRKEVYKTPFGDEVLWVDVEQGQNSGGQTPEKKVR